SEGNPMFREADSRDTYLSGLYDVVQNSRAIQEASRYYSATQKDALGAALQTQGASAQDIQSYTANAGNQPTYIEVNNSNAGSYNDWKGKFTLVTSSGQSYSVQQPRVVFPLGGDVYRSGD